jgi:cytochrome c oxidase subunit IV
MATEQNHKSVTEEHEDQQSHGVQMYLRFGAMVLTAMVIMYAVMFMASWEWGHVRWSVSRFFMALTMGGTMGVVMLAWMLNMYRNAKLNAAVVAVSLLLLVGGVVLDRTQATIQDNDFMTSMIPHHSMAILRAERSNLADARVCELAVEISEAQRREILEMEWLMDDIEQNGPATTAAEAEARAVPHFEVSADRECPSG